MERKKINFKYRISSRLANLLKVEAGDLGYKDTTAYILSIVEKRDKNMINFKNNKLFKIYLLAKYKNNFNQLKNILMNKENYLMKDITPILSFINETFYLDLLTDFSIGDKKENKIIAEIDLIKETISSIRIDEELYKTLEEEYSKNFKSLNDYFGNILVVRNFDKSAASEIEDFKCFIISKISQMLNILVKNQHSHFLKNKKYDFNYIFQELKTINKKLVSLIGNKL